MGSTPRKGWMKLEWSRLPMDSKVVCIEDGVWYTGCQGTVVGYSQAKQVPTLSIRITSIPEYQYKQNYHANIGDIATGQPIGWYSIIN